LRRGALYSFAATSLAALSISAATGLASSPFHALYGAAKAGLAHYLEGLDYKYRVHGLRVVCVKPGFVKTSMTTGLKPPPFAGEADGVAAEFLPREPLLFEKQAHLCPTAPFSSR
jgi:NAD(P)-dependent dehydrogenase (short-subunit alcohol dehydrogenase family)